MAVKYDFVIDNSSYDDASTHFGLVIADRMSYAKENGPFMFKVEFLVHESRRKATRFPALKVNIPIAASYEGYTQDEAIEMILGYIKNQIKQKYHEFQSYYKGKAGFVTDALDLLGGLDISKDIDFDADPKETAEKDKKIAEFMETAKNTVAQKSMDA